jgi:uncharacterized SAM-binding protein YcdF (DUF218 family)
MLHLCLGHQSRFAMFFILSKTLYYLMMPLTWVLGIFLFALFTGSQCRRKRLLTAGIVLVWVLGNSFLVNEALLRWEIPPVPVARIQQPYDVAIVLTGITNSTKQPRDRTYFEKGADRIMHTLQLYKAGKVKKILITGGSASLSGQKQTEAGELATFLRMAGVPDQDVILEVQARNTRENALFSAPILKKRFPGQRYLLVTSAFHMRRAEGCFLKAGIQVDGFSTDFYTYQRSFTPDKWLLPSEGAFGKWGTLIHEMVGYLVYKVTGYC